MKSLAKGSASGCLVWFLGFGVLSFCFCSMAAFVGGLSSTLQADYVAGLLEPYLCPADSTAEIITFQTTATDEFGNESPATGFEMQCVNARGEIVRDPSPDYAFYWIGLLGVGSLIGAALLAILFAAPIGAMVGRLARKNAGNKSANVLPK